MKINLKKTSYLVSSKNLETIAIAYSKSDGYDWSGWLILIDNYKEMVDSEKGWKSHPVQLGSELFFKWIKFLLENEIFIEPTDSFRQLTCLSGVEANTIIFRYEIDGIRPDFSYFESRIKANSLEFVLSGGNDSDSPFANRQALKDRFYKTYQHLTRSIIAPKVFLNIVSSGPKNPIICGYLDEIDLLNLSSPYLKDLRIRVYSGKTAILKVVCTSRLTLDSVKLKGKSGVIFSCQDDLFNRLDVKIIELNNSKIKQLEANSFKELYIQENCEIGSLKFEMGKGELNTFRPHIGEHLTIEMLFDKQLDNLYLRGEELLEKLIKLLAGCREYWGEINPYIKINIQDCQGLEQLEYPILKDFKALMPSVLCIW